MPDRAAIVLVLAALVAWGAFVWWKRTSTPATRALSLPDVAVRVPPLSWLSGLELRA
jgi:hypothetical protein